MCNIGHDSTKHKIGKDKDKVFDSDLDVRLGKNHTYYVLFASCHHKTNDSEQHVESDYEKGRKATYHHKILSDELSRHGLKYHDPFEPGNFETLHIDNISRDIIQELNKKKQLLKFQDQEASTCQEKVEPKLAE